MASTAPEIVRLTTNDRTRQLYLRSTIQFHYDEDARFTGERKVSTDHYAHTLSESPALKPELFSWEWNAAEPRWPHVHVHRRNPDFKGLGKLHVPTGRVFFEDVLRFLFHDLDIRPARDDWREVLDETAGRVGRWATWGGRR